MKIGVNMFLWTTVFDRSHLPLLPKIKAAGFDGVELSMFDPATFDAHVVRQGLEENGLECTIAAVLGHNVNMISDDADTRKRARTHLEDCTKQAANVGAKIIAGPLYSPVGHLPGRRRTPDEWNWAVECYRELGPTLKQHEITIAIEPLNRFETYFLNTVADAAQLCDEIDHPNVGILFDTFHANIEEKNIAEGFRRVASHLKHVHTCENDRGTPGTGHIPWPEVFAALREIGYDGWLTIESFGFSSGELSAAASIWRDLAPTPDEIAYEGIKFLRRHALNLKQQPVGA